MDSHWLTILMSKGIELEQGVRSRVRQELESRGIRWNWVDVASTIEDISPKFSNAAMSYALNYLKPFSAGLSLRISHLSDKHIEAILPHKQRNLNTMGAIHEGALVTAVVESLQVLWLRLAPVGDIEFHFDQIHTDLFHPVRSEARIRCEISEDYRERILTELRTKQSSKAETQVKIYDDRDQLMGEMKVLIKMNYQPRIESKK